MARHEAGIGARGLAVAPEPAIEQQPKLVEGVGVKAPGNGTERSLDHHWYGNRRPSNLCERSQPERHSFPPQGAWCMDQGCRRIDPNPVWG